MMVTGGRNDAAGVMMRGGRNKLRPYFGHVGAQS
jgi:hypothetical protein